MGLKREVIENMAIDAFLTGLKIKEIGYQVLHQMPPPFDMAMAVRLVRVCESQHQAMD